MHQPTASPRLPSMKRASKRLQSARLPVHFEWLPTLPPAKVTARARPEVGARNRSRWHAWCVGLAGVLSPGSRSDRSPRKRGRSTRGARNPPSRSRLPRHDGAGCDRGDGMQRGSPDGPRPSPRGAVGIRGRESARHLPLSNLVGCPGRGGGARATGWVETRTRSCRRACRCDLHRPLGRRDPTAVPSSNATDGRSGSGTSHRRPSASRGRCFEGEVVP
jgi:hypothetical protein